MRFDRSLYAEHLRLDALNLGKAVARLNNAADMCERQHARRYVLEDAVRHALKNGQMGKQTRRLLKQALKECA